jgi:hypothetical protein
MTEADWLTGSGPFPMLRHLTHEQISSIAVGTELRPVLKRRAQFLASNRQLRLFVCALFRESDKVFPHSQANRDGIARVEEEPETDPTGDWGWAACMQAGELPGGVGFTLEAVLANAGIQETGVPPATAAALLREIVGNPWLVVERRHERCTSRKRNPYPGERLFVFDDRWLTPTVRGLGGVIYEERCFERLPILADALEDAGCNQADLLGHLRGPGPHVRGCWALDLILGKE